jgi:hypothetical protein
MRPSKNRRARIAEQEIAARIAARIAEQEPPSKTTSACTDAHVHVELLLD